VLLFVLLLLLLLLLLRLRLPLRLSLMQRRRGCLPQLPRSWPRGWALRHDRGWPMLRLMLRRGSHKAGE